MPRGIYALEDEKAPWLKERLVFPSTSECLAWMEKHVDDKEHPSNEAQPHLEHIFTFLTSWEQVEKHLLAKIDEYDRRFPPATPVEPLPASNVFAPASAGTESSGESGDGACPPHVVAGIAAALQARLKLPIHQRLNRAATRNTLSYLFHHMRCGIYVMIRAGKLRLFAPFVNAKYHNTWSGALKWRVVKPGTQQAGNVEDMPLGQDVEGYYGAKMATGCREENVVPNVGEWWANGNIICNEHCPPGQAEAESQLWGDQLLVPLRDMLHTMCEKRTVPDCEFFINKRDYPHLKVHVSEGEEGSNGSGEPSCVPVEPYGFIFDCDDRDPTQDVPLMREAHYAYAPIGSFYCGAPSRFADLPVPTSEDWEAATGLVFPPSFKRERDRKTGELKFDKPRDLFTEANFRKFDCAWETKKSTALFRGTATGGGVTEATNQRLAAAGLSHRWKSDPSKAGLLDAAITGWNRRDKKIAGQPMLCLDPKSFPFEGGKKMYVPIYEQSAYKYLLYIDGHCAACRYAFMMRLGSVILKVESRGVADRMWYFPLLQPWVDHVPIAPDLSDLAEKIEWCRTHDNECRAMAAKAKDLWNKYCSQEGVLDYMQLFCHSLAAQTQYPPAWWSPPAAPVPPPIAPSGSSGHFCDRKKGTFCARCLDEQQAEKLATAAAAAAAAATAAASTGTTATKAGGLQGGAAAASSGTSHEMPSMTAPVNPKKKQRVMKKLKVSPKD